MDLHRHTAGQPCPEWLFSLAAEVVPPLLSYGVRSTEAAYEKRVTAEILGVQLRDAEGFRVGRQQIPQPLMEAFRKCMASLIEVELERDGDGVVECCISQRQVVCRHTPHGNVAMITSKWTF